MTYDQFLYMVESAADKDYMDKRFAASLQGVDLDKATKRTPAKQAPADGLLFKSPDDYAKMTPEQRAAATAELMNKMRKTGMVT